MTSRTAYSTWTPQKPTLFGGHYLRNHSTLDKGVSGYIGTVQHKEHSPEVLSIPPRTPCIYVYKISKTDLTFDADELRTPSHGYKTDSYLTEIRTVMACKSDGELVAVHAMKAKE